MALRVGLDMDGVVADFRSAFEAIAHGHASESPIDPKVGNFSDGDVRRAWTKILRTPNWWTTLQPYEPAQLARLYQMARQGGWEVVFMTKRPATAGEPIQFQTQYWLERNGFYYPGVVTVPGSRGELANALKLDAVVDDQLFNCIDVVTGSHAKAILLLRDRDQNTENLALTRGIAVVHTLEESLDALQRLDSAQAERKGRLQRLSDWFQMKEPGGLDDVPSPGRAMLRRDLSDPDRS